MSQPIWDASDHVKERLDKIMELSARFGFDGKRGLPLRQDVFDEVTLMVDNELFTAAPRAGLALRLTDSGCVTVAIKSGSRAVIFTVYCKGYIEGIRVLGSRDCTEDFRYRCDLRADFDHMLCDLRDKIKWVRTGKEPSCVR